VRGHVCEGDGVRRCMSNGEALGATSRERSRRIPTSKKEEPTSRGHEGRGASFRDRKREREREKERQRVVVVVCVVEVEIREQHPEKSGAKSIGRV